MELILPIIISGFNLEISNSLQIKNNKIIIFLSDGSTACLKIENAT